MKQLRRLFRRPWLVALLVLATAAAPAVWMWYGVRQEAAQRDQERLKEMASAAKDMLVTHIMEHQTLINVWCLRAAAAADLAQPDWLGEMSAECDRSRYRLVGLAQWEGERLLVRQLLAGRERTALEVGADLTAKPEIRQGLATGPRQDSSILSISSQWPNLVGERVMALRSFEHRTSGRMVLFAWLYAPDFLQPEETLFHHRDASGILGADVLKQQFLPYVGEGLLTITPVNEQEWRLARAAPGLHATIQLSIPTGSMNLVFTPGAKFSRDSLSGESRVLGGAGLLIAVLLALLAWLQARQRHMLTAEVQARTAELGKTRDELRAALEMERELVSMKSQFVNTVSHEFRTPLGVILSSADILTHYLDRLPEAARLQHLQDIHDSSLNMSRMLEQVLALGQMDSGKSACNAQPVNLPQLLGRIVDETRSAHGGQVQLCLDEELGDAEADEVLLRHILLNLLSNARKYSPEHACIELSARRVRDQLVIDVADHGIGIPSQDLPHIFEAFSRASNVAQAPGTGLGLTIVKRCVQLHGGTIALQSTAGEGTTVTVNLPVFST